MNGFTCLYAAATDVNPSAYLCALSPSKGALGVSGGEIHRVAVMIIGPQRGRCRRIGFVVVAATRIVEQKWDDRQQADHDNADHGDGRDEELDDGHSSILPPPNCAASVTQIA